ncbi:UNKNOWN [Stylonychia lemnae]|uniref:Uncharacterized protein n=1 Tax=Stylonychia lemnae TaxID=5949 RepID=A0A078AFX6_STYLE|nr:UNKNOWN [Stylonychia lemnae]|eukprot:CDW81195.1 UNKNOWN [Stylonychia lemnae]
MQLIQNRSKFLDNKFKTEGQVESKIKQLKQNMSQKNITQLPFLARQTSEKNGMTLHNTVTTIDNSMQSTNGPIFKRKMSQQKIDTNYYDETPLIMQDTNALQGSKDLLVNKTRPLVDQIFTPFRKRYALISEDEKKTINSFIIKVDPRAPEATKKKQNTKAILLKECARPAEDGKVDPDDEKKYLKSKSKPKNKNIQTKSLKRMQLLKELNLEMEVKKAASSPDIPLSKHNLMFQTGSQIFSSSINGPQEYLNQTNNQSIVNNTSSQINTTPIPSSLRKSQSFYFNKTITAPFFKSTQDYPSPQIFKYDNSVSTRQFLMSTQTFHTITEMSQSRNGDVQRLGSIVSECGTLTKGTNMSPYFFKKRKVTKRNLKKLSNSKNRVLLKDLAL